MGWEIGYDAQWKRDIGYGVPATCDHPGCGAPIDRGLGFVCGSDPFGGDHGCGLFFCEQHQMFARRRRRTVQLCSRCLRRKEPFEPTPDTCEWIQHKLRHSSWGPWRKENPERVAELKAALAGLKAAEAER